MIGRYLKNYSKDLMKQIKSIDDIEFIHVPKTAGTTILAHLAKLDPIRFDTDRDLFTACQINASNADFARRCSFAVIRNPFERIMSIWRYEKKRGLETRISIDEMHMLSDFDRWLEHRHCTLNWNRAHMILPQWYWVSDWAQTQLVDEIFRYEELDKCFDWLSFKLNTIIDRSIMLNTSPGNANYKNVSARSKQIMIELSKIDCERFRYDW